MHADIRVRRRSRARYHAVPTQRLSDDPALLSPIKCVVRTENHGLDRCAEMDLDYF